MKKKFKYFAMAAAALLAMSACNNETDEQAPQKGKQPVQFQMTMGNATRTTTGTTDRTTTWDEGDAVGIFVYKHGETTNPVATNAKYVLTGDNWVTTTGSEIYAEEAYDYYAYYPYQAGVTDPAQISVSAIADQSTAAGVDYGKSDILASQNKSVAANAVTVPLLFKHMFAMVEVKVEGDKVSKQPTKVVLKGVKLDATLNITAETPSATPKADAIATDVTMYYLTKATDVSKAPFSFRAVVPAQEIAAATPLVAIYAPDADNKTYTMQHSATVTYDAGKFRQLVVSIATAKVSLTIPKGDLTIDPWGTSTDVPGTGEEAAVTVLTLSLPSDLSALAEYKTWGNTTAATGSNNFWFKRIPTTAAAATTIAYDPTENALALAVNWDGTNNNSRGSWNNSNISFHSASRFEQTTYTLSFWVKSNTANGNIGAGISNSKDDNFFQICNAAWADWARTVTTTNLKANTDWTNITYNFNFNKKFNNGASSGVTSYSNTVADDVKGINILFYSYFNNSETSTAGVAAGNTLYIKDIKLEKYTAPAP